MTSTATQLQNLVRPVAWAGERLLPVDARLRSLLPNGGLRRGSTVAVSGSTSLALATAAAASAQGSWCAATGFTSLGLLACADLGIALERFALVPRPGKQLPSVAAALVDAFDVVLVRLAGSTALAQADARRLMARARERGSVLVPVVDDQRSWPQADVRLHCDGVRWQGLGVGHGHLKASQLAVSATGRGIAPHSNSLTLMAS